MSQTWAEVNSAVARAMSGQGKGFGVAGGPAGGPGGAPAASNPLCTIYGAIKPILQGLQQFPLIPPNWRDAIGKFINLMEVVCKSGGGAAAFEPPSFDRIDAAVNRGLSDYLRDHAQSMSLAAAGPIPDWVSQIPKEICSIYQAVKPILNFASPFLPPTWQAAISIFMRLMDMVCNQPG